MRISRLLTLFPILVLAEQTDPGHVTAHRLNRVEYNNTVRDLLAIDFQPAADFPADDSGYGFDNIGDVLSLSPILMEKYLAAAEKIAKASILPPPPPQPTTVRHGRGENRGSTKAPGLIVSHRFPVEGDYTFVATLVYRPDPVTLAFSVDGQPYPSTNVQDGADHWRTAEVHAHVSAGPHTLDAELIPDGPRAPDPDFESGKSDKPLRDPMIGNIEIRGPYHPVTPPPSESYRRVFTCTDPGPQSLLCARVDLANLARRAYRRPVTSAEVDGLVRFVQMALDQGDSFDHGMQVALTAILVSPHFLFRIERAPDPANPSAHDIGQFELATRLSYFLWSSMPDEELFRLAAQQDLRKPRILDAQVRRMLADPKSKALVDNFGGQWLQLRNLDRIQPDPDHFPNFNDDLRRDMKRETELFFQSIIREDRNILDFIDAGYTFVNARLAKFYGLPEVDSNQFQRVQLPPDSHRGGVITQAAILTASSFPNRTSPVLRGKWILDNILDAPPPPPPPDVPNLDEKAVGSSASLRQQLEAHRTNPVCNACHASMDPLGFGLENFDAIGRWRTKDGNFPIDATGKLPNGKTFDGPEGLKQILLSDQSVFTKCLAEKLLTYALGRGLEDYDQPAVRSIVTKTAASEYRFSALVEAIVSSDPFQMAHAPAPVQSGKGTNP
jgi:uncharacterized protein DUF1592/uncharacterized protein DUF1588/uncharacterized protein DUF1587/uncharacterized protein DUF1585/uncharacterized protein DUF1595